MKITYYLEDGYAGNRWRPHHVEINQGDIDECDTKEEFEELVEMMIKEDMENSISPAYAMPEWPGKKMIDEKGDSEE